jgi:hypothetical protein
MTEQDPEPFWCEHDDCNREATVECLNPASDSYPEWIEHLCVEHAVQSGFCYLCGTFWAGCEDFDFSPVWGVCPNCRESEWEEDDDGGLMLPAYYDDDQYADDSLDYEEE